MKVPYDEALGVRVIKEGPARTILEMDVDAAWHNPHGSLHGGIVAGLADSAMGRTVSHAGPCANTDLCVRYLRPVTAGTLRATSRVLRKGRRTWHMESDVTDADGELVARASSTFMLR